MPEYVVEVYELHSSKVRVTANSRAEAIKLVQQGEGKTEDGLEYIDTMSVKPYSVLEEENPGILKELNDVGVKVDEDDETFIRSVEED